MVPAASVAPAVSVVLVQQAEPAAKATIRCSALRAVPSVVLAVRVVTVVAVAAAVAA